MGTHSESKNGTKILSPELTPNFGAKTEPRFNKILEPCFQNENEPQKWFARPRRGGFRETIIGGQKRALDVMQANPPRRVLQMRFWQSLRLALWPRGGGPPGAQRTRAAPSGSHSAHGGSAVRLATRWQSQVLAPSARARRAMCACGGIYIDACI